MKIGILNGPNLNLLGKREPSVYGNLTLDDLKNALSQKAEGKNITLEFAQNNVEGELINVIQNWAAQGFYGVIFNPGAYTHTSVALRDAISSVNLRFVEVHLTNVYKREEFRHRSYTAGVSDGIISGLGFFGYAAALDYLTQNAGENE